jgi:indolepyruvate ferredoxin oxidoreductase alpha subunit
VNNKTNVTIIISDNEAVGMTGGQESSATGDRLVNICLGIGVEPEHLRVIVPVKKNFEEMKNMIREEIEYNGVSVIIPRRECIQTYARKAKAK